MPWICHGVQVCKIKYDFRRYLPRFRGELDVPRSQCTPYGKSPPKKKPIYMGVSLKWWVSPPISTPSVFSRKKPMGLLGKPTILGANKIPKKSQPTETQAALAGHTLATLAAPGAAAWEPRKSQARGVSLTFFSFLFFGLVKMVDFPNNPGSFHIPQKFDIVHMCIFKYIHIIIYV